MSIKKYHRIIGLVMLTPLCIWAITGALFLVKPGWGPAYETLTLQHHPIRHQIVLQSPDKWLQVRQLRTVIGEHLLVADADGWHQLDPINQQRRALPSPTQLKTLLEQAVMSNPDRYGQIKHINGNIAHTSTGVQITLNWNDMSLHQRGRDTRLISQLYKLHYLEWTGHPIIDATLAVLGLSLLTLLSLLGGWMCFKPRVPQCD